MNVELKTLLIVVLAATVCLSAPASADDATDLDTVLEGFSDQADLSTEEILEGFDEEDPESGMETAPTDESALSIFQFSGHAKIGASVNIAHPSPPPGQTDWRGLSRLRPEFQLETKVDLHQTWQAYASAKAAWDAAYGMGDRDTFTGQVLSRNESEVELREAWLSGQLSNSLDLKIGRQVVVWGKSDNIRVTDVLNALDLREPGLTDIEDLRLPAAMIRLDHYTGPWQLTAMMIPEIRFNKTPVWGSDFYPSAAPLPPEAVPSDSSTNAEYAAALSGVFSGWDMALYFADIYDDTPHAEPAPGWPPSMRLCHARLTMVGAAGNLAWGNWLFKAETAWFQGLEFFHGQGEDFDRMDILGGVEYAGFSDTTVTLEMVSRRILDFRDRLKAAPDQAAEEKIQSALRISRDFLNETLNLTLLALTYGPTGQDGALQRFTAQYDLSDAVEITGGLVLYQSGDLPEMQNIGDNDRIYLEVKYSY